MTTSTTTSKMATNRNFNRQSARSTDEAPMVITRLSGWINMGEPGTVAPAWIVPTRIHTLTR